MSSVDLSGVASEPLQLVVPKSFQHADTALRELNRLLVIVGLCALLVGTLLMLSISGLITGPIEQLTRSVQQYGRSAGVPVLPLQGIREVRELREAFLAMSTETREKNQALLESERLATIGRMASSVSHDLRHYLAAVYANAEFLVSSRLSEAERADLFGEIRMAVHGTTDLIDSLLIFSRSDGAAYRTPELLVDILDRALTLVRAHPDAQGVDLATPDLLSPDPATSDQQARHTHVLVDARQVERALYNLLLNACQAARQSSDIPRVSAAIATAEAAIEVRIVDNGTGVAEAIRGSLFEPFVSEGKQNGTGLGLTLADVVAREHGGSVTLVGSRPGETIFRFSITRLSSESSPLGTEQTLESYR